MHRRFYLLLIVFFIAPVLLYSQGNFSTSLHSTRLGKATAYDKENGGMELLTNIPLEQLPCQSCHAKTYPDGADVDPASYEPSCRDCHGQPLSTDIVESTCLGCHSRKTAEKNMYPEHENPHVEKGMKCWDCHEKEELHGDDGVKYTGMQAEGAIKAKCTNCHSLDDLPSNSEHNTHAKSGKFECQACHIKAIVQCQNCHIESVQTDSHIKRALMQVKDFQLLVKRRGKYISGSYMTHVHGGKSNVIIAPLSGHLITEEGKKCVDCHNNMGGQNAAIKEYNETGFIQMLKWNPETKKMINAKGVIPLPEDWDRALKFDYADYEGNPAEPSDPEQWVFLKSESDNAHLFFCEPLTAEEMGKLGFTRDPSAVPSAANDKFLLKQNYPNPAVENTRITFRLLEYSHVNLSVYDLTGRLVTTIIDNDMNPNEYSPGFYTGGLPNGSYVYRLQAGNHVESMVMTVKR